MRFIILLLAALFGYVGSAGAVIEVPSKSVWSITDVDSLQFCNKCDPNSISSANRIENYKRTIADTVAMGAKHILVYNVIGTDQKARLGEFATALGQYNNAAAADAKACMAIMYADYGTSHTNEFIQDNWLAAWSNGGANYCVINGQPVIASLDERTNWACDKNKMNNVFNRLAKFVTAPNNITSVHWLAAFGETSEYDSWYNDCRGLMTDSGVPTTYSYLEMANDNPQYATNAAARSAAVKNGGGRYVLGIPSASATNCGDFCGTASDASAYRYAEFGGFSKALAAWRAGISDVAYTYGPGGRVSRDEFASTATRCDANDMATPSAECTSPVAAKLAMVPGAPTSGTATTPTDPPPTDPPPTDPPPSGSGMILAGSQCDNPAVPAPAAELGLTKLDMCDDFSTDSIARGSDTTMVSRKHLWNTETSSSFGGSFKHPAGDITFPGGGVARLQLTANQYQKAIQSTQRRGSKVNGYWVNRKNKGAYVEVRWKQLSASGGQIAFWTMDLCHWDRYPADCQATNTPTGRFLEIDFFEYSTGGHFLHDWYAPPNNGKAQQMNPWTCGSAQYGPSAKNGVWMTSAYRIDPIATGTIRYYTNGSQTHTDSKSECSSFPMNLLGDGRHQILIGGKPGDAFELDYVRVWTHPDEPAKSDDPKWW